MPRFRWRQGPRHGRWHPTRREAVEAAVRAGVADRDEHNPDRIWWDVLAEIEEQPGGAS